jgi:2-methylcitrate dehydratase PrpD
VDPSDAIADLGRRFECEKILFKKYPSCGLTLGSTDVVLSLMQEMEGRVDPVTDVERVEVRVPPYMYRLVGHPFEVGTTPRVNAQFSIRYCAANALLRGGSKLAHFEEGAVRDPKVLEMVRCVDVTMDPAMALRGHTPVDMTTNMKDGWAFFRQLDIAPGLSGNPLTQTEHDARFRECIGYARRPIHKEKVDRIVESVTHVEDLSDIRTLISLFLP